jgi:geranylgeranyl diphosphate synthase type I
MTTNPWARHRALLEESINQAAADIDFSHAELVREHMAASNESGAQVPGVLCLRAAEALGVPAESALPGATALALVAQMAEVFLGLESQDGGASISTAWGMPRALNAGDAFFAAAHHAVLADDGEISVQRRLRALSILDDATRGFVEALEAAGEGASVSQGEQSLLSAALLLAGLYAGADDETLSRLERLGTAWANLDAQALEAAMASDLRAALTAAS